jgi:hypothetical protein
MGRDANPCGLARRTPLCLFKAVNALDPPLGPSRQVPAVFGGGRF